MLQSLARAGENDNASIATAYMAITKDKSKEIWVDAEKKLKGSYLGTSARTQRRKDQNLREKEEKDAISRSRCVRLSFSILI